MIRRCPGTSAEWTLFESTWGVPQPQLERAPSPHAAATCSGCPNTKACTCSWQRRMSMPACAKPEIEPHEMSAVMYTSRTRLRWIHESPA